MSLDRRLTKTTIGIQTEENIWQKNQDEIDMIQNIKKYEELKQKEHLLRQEIRQIKDSRDKYCEKYCKQYQQNKKLRQINEALKEKIKQLQNKSQLTKKIKQLQNESQLKRLKQQDKQKFISQIKEIYYQNNILGQLEKQNNKLQQQKNTKSYVDLSIKNMFESKSSSQNLQEQYLQLFSSSMTLKSQKQQLSQKKKLSIIFNQSSISKSKNDFSEDDFCFSKQNMSLCDLVNQMQKKIFHPQAKDQLYRIFFQKFYQIKQKKDEIKLKINNSAELSYKNQKQISTILIDGIVECQNSQHLLTMSFQSCGIFNNSLSILMEKQYNIKSLNLQDNNLTTFDISLFNVRNLEELNLARNKICKLPQNLTILQHLRILQVHENNIEKIPTNLLVLEYLEIFTFYLNYLNQSQIRHLTKELQKRHNGRLVFTLRPHSNGFCLKTRLTDR